MTNLLAGSRLHFGSSHRKSSLNSPKQRIRDFKAKLRVVEQSSHGLSGLEKLLAFEAVTQMLLHRDGRGDVQLVIDVSIDVIEALSAIHSWSCCLRSDSMR